MNGGNIPGGVNKYSEYRRIRFERANRPLGRMTWWRVVLGVALLVFVLFLSGTVSSSLAARGHFKAAKAVMVSPRWMEQYRPELKGFIEAGVLYEDGDYEGAFAGFDAQGALEAAKAMRSVSAVKLAAQRLEGGDFDGAFDAAMAADPSLLPEDAQESLLLVCARLRDHYAANADGDRAARLQSLPDAQ